MTIMFSNANDALIHMARVLQTKGRVFTGRTGDVTELKNVTFTLTRPLEREVTVPPRRASLAAQIAETLWVLSGRNDVEFISHYLPRAKDFSDDGVTWRAGYGPRLRNWHGVDQLDAVATMLANDPTTRRAVINLFDPAADLLSDSVDVPCNNWLVLQLVDRAGGPELDLFVSTRSNDLIWGWSGINQFEWSVLLEAIAWIVGATPGRVHYNIASLHFYPRHAQMVADVAAYAGTEWPAGGQPAMTGCRHTPSTAQGRFKLFEAELAQIVGYAEQLHRGETEPPGLYALPLFRYFAEVLHNHWRKQPKLPDDRTFVQTRPAGTPAGVKGAVKLKEEKGKVYKGSWCARGELFSILPNIARKIDRLGHPGAGDSEWDTLVDLFNYIVLYRCWTMGDPEAENFATQAERLFWYTYSDSGRKLWAGKTEEQLNEEIRETFNEFLAAVESQKSYDRWTRQEIIRQIVAKVACRRVFQEGAGE
jgi:thymidylate synthase